MPSSTVQEMLDEEPEINLTPMIDIVFLLLIFFMLMKFKSLEKRYDTFLPKDEGSNISPPTPIQQLRVKLEIQTGDTGKVNIIPDPSMGAFRPIPWEQDINAMFDKLTNMMVDGMNYIGDKVEIAPQWEVPFEYVALTVDAVHRAQEPLIKTGKMREEDRKRITFKLPPPTGVAE